MSFSTVPLKNGTCYTAISAINSIEVVHAVRDDVTHVSVKPVNGTLYDWFKAGKTSVWTQAVMSVTTRYFTTRRDIIQ